MKYQYIQQLSQQVPYISSIKSTGTLAKTSIGIFKHADQDPEH